MAQKTGVTTLSMKHPRILLLLYLLLFTLLVEGTDDSSFPYSITGKVFDNLTGICRSSVDLNITAATTGFLGIVKATDVPAGCGVAYLLTGDNISWITGEMITVESINTGLTGYAGSSSAPGTDYQSVQIDLYLNDIISPRYYSVSSDPLNPRRGENKTIYTHWKDNSGFITLVVTHNASGVWNNYTVVENENISQSRSVYDNGKRIDAYIDTTNTTRGTSVSWSLLAWDRSGNLNNSFPMLSFTVQNALPLVDPAAVTPSYPYANESLSCVAVASDLDGDNVTLYYSWLVNGVLLNQSGTSLGVGNFTQGDNVTCRIIPFDGFENGSARDNTVQIRSSGQLWFQKILSSGWNLLSLPVAFS